MGGALTSMLALLRLWRLLSDLEVENILFQDVYKCFLLLSSNEIHSTIDNIQFLDRKSVV